jgi:hypothetical protein
VVVGEGGDVGWGIEGGVWGGALDGEGGVWGGALDGEGEGTS